MSCENTCLYAQLQITCSSDSVPIRFKSSRESKPIIRISTGTKLTAIAQANDFVKVIYKSDTGYMSKSFVLEINDHTSDSINSILDNKINKLITSGKYDDALALSKKLKPKFIDKLNNLPNEIPIVVDKKIYTDNTINDAIKLYGVEDDRQSFVSGDYDSITLIWHCAKGFYRSISYTFKDGEYKKESEYISNCIGK